MAFNAEQRKISTILSGDWQYTIPRYQRKYVWEEKQWRELLDDLKYCLENEKYFFSPRLDTFPWEFCF